MGMAEFSDAAILITFLLILSSVGMIFQIVFAKNAVSLDEIKISIFTRMIAKYACLVGLVIAMVILSF